MTRREYKALLELKRWIVAAIPNHKEAVRLIEALEPLGRGIHPGDKGEVSALRLDEINETEEGPRVSRFTVKIRFGGRVVVPSSVRLLPVGGAR